MERKKHIFFEQKKKLWLLPFFLCFLCFFDAQASQKPPFPLAEDLLKGLHEDTYCRLLLGKPTAPIVFVAYGSLSCGECAFLKEELDKIFQKYKKNNVVSVLIKDIPTDQYSFCASRIAWCCKKTAPTLYPYLFRHQQQWITSRNWQEALCTLAEKKGLSKKKSWEALHDKKLALRLLGRRRDEMQKVDLRIVPMVFLVKRAKGKKDQVEEVDPYDFSHLDRLVQKHLASL